MPRTAKFTPPASVAYKLKAHVAEVTKARSKSHGLRFTILDGLPGDAANMRMNKTRSIMVRKPSRYERATIEKRFGEMCATFAMRICGGFRLIVIAGPSKGGPLANSKAIKSVNDSPDATDAALLGVLEKLAPDAVRTIKAENLKIDCKTCRCVHGKRGPFALSGAKQHGDC